MNICIIIFHNIVFFFNGTVYCIFICIHMNRCDIHCICTVSISADPLCKNDERIQLHKYIAHLETKGKDLIVFSIMLLCKVFLKYINFCRFIILSTSTWSHFYKETTPQNCKKYLNNNTFILNQLSLLIAWSNFENIWSHKMWNHGLLDDKCIINAENYLILTWPKKYCIF